MAISQHEVAEALLGRRIHLTVKFFSVLWVTAQHLVL
jgi:hypothetical protein